MPFITTTTNMESTLDLRVYNSYTVHEHQRTIVVSGTLDDGMRPLPSTACVARAFSCSAIVSYEPEENPASSTPPPPHPHRNPRLNPPEPPEPHAPPENNPPPEIHTLPAKCPSGKGFDAGSPIRCLHKEPGRYICMSPVGWARPHCQRVFPSVFLLRQHLRAGRAERNCLALVRPSDSARPLSGHRPSAA
ncbi:uncharacterized protein BO72DRAFT_497580 [Aspergillus fijiensis CBS 313.89]|uniref:Uncharacterized protein n=1 Tax=Aspergillus fijiensis CBS 313.89 TaxID=1448319 RepID=A0A8G1RMB0_9EURO|nr:uncharacterized protein BO72DRAFT_497580 [Aspergillus fijiensis CBS 313.89]RAK75849.1 hypothetical protein BO72DRAFT_497580 [Aspergillus fijiensis CBS 313.89]